MDTNWCECIFSFATNDVFNMTKRHRKPQHKIPFKIIATNKFPQSYGTHLTIVFTLTEI